MSVLSMPRSRLVVALFAVALFLGAGVFWLVRLAVGDEIGDSTPIGGPLAAPSTSSPATTAAPILSTITTGPMTAVPPVVRATTTKPRSTTPPVPSRGITVGGATLNTDHPRTMCALFRNSGFGVPIQVTGVSLVGSGVKLSTKWCSGSDGDNDNFSASQLCKAGTVLQPGGDGCYHGIEAILADPPAAGSEPEQRFATVRLGLKARCTTSGVLPCSDDELRTSPPSVSNPVDVTWTDKGLTVCVNIEVPEYPYCP